MYEAHERGVGDIDAKKRGTGVKGRLDVFREAGAQTCIVPGEPEQKKGVEGG